MTTTTESYQRCEVCGTSIGDAGYLWYFDFDSDGDVDGLDNGQFNRRFGQS